MSDPRPTFPLRIKLPELEAMIWGSEPEDEDEDEGD